MTRVVVTGVGVETPLGADPERLLERLVAGERGVAAPRRYGAWRPPSRGLGEVDDERIEAIRAAHPDLCAVAERRTLLGVSAARAALARAGVAPGRHPRAAVFLGTGPGTQRLEDVQRLADAPRDLGARLALAPTLDARSSLAEPAESPAVRVARAHGLGGRVVAVLTACSAANQALGLALRALRAGECDLAVAGGCDSQNNPLGLVFFVLLGASATGEGDAAALCRPFDRRRNGLVMGEGAGVAVLETEAHARARGAPILAEVAGYGASLDAWRTTAPPPDGRGAKEAMAEALCDAGLAPADVDYVHAHGTGTKRNDPAEVRALHALFGPHARALAVSSSKGALGHLLSAAAGVSFVVTALALARGWIPPTANLEEPDAACDLDLVPGRGRPARLRAALNNSFAFGGQNASMALRRYAPEEPPR